MGSIIISYWANRDETRRIIALNQDERLALDRIFKEYPNREPHLCSKNPWGRGSWLCRCSFCRMFMAIHQAHTIGGHDTKPHNLNTAEACTDCGFDLARFRTEEEDGCPHRHVRRAQNRLVFAECDLQSSNRALEKIYAETIPRIQEQTRKYEKILAQRQEELRLAELAERRAKHG